MMFSMHALEADPKGLFDLFLKEAGAKLVFEMTGKKKVGDPSRLSAEEIMRIQYSYCAFSILAEENGKESAKRWLRRGNIFLKSPTKAFRRWPVSKLYVAMSRVMDCYKASRGILP